MRHHKFRKDACRGALVMGLLRPEWQAFMAAEEAGAMPV
jgi:hypothetical protein